MLSPHDANVVASDPDLPALRFILDDEAALELFQEICPELQPTSVRCTYLRYKPGTSCLAAFALQTRQGERLFYVKGYSQANRDKLAKAFGRADRLGSERPRYLVFEKLSLMIASFPHDDELPALEQLFGGGDDRPLLSRLVPELNGLQTARIVTLRYKPERRFVARLDVAGKPAAVLKIHTESRYQQARRAMKSIGPELEFPTARALGHSDRHHSLLMSWLAGTPLSSFLQPSFFLSRQPSSSVWEAVGETLARLHGLPTRKLPSRTLDRETREIEQQSKDFSYVSENLAARLHKLTELCVAAMSKSFSTAVPTHGDFHIGQILVDAESVSVIDLDNVAIGNAAYDLGNFIANLERVKLLGTIQEVQIQQFLAAFLDGYQRQANRHIDHRSVQIYTASGLLRLIHEPFRHRLSDWPNQQEKLLQRVEKILSKASKTSARAIEIEKVTRSQTALIHEVKVVDPFGAGDDTCLPWLDDALKPSLARQVIGEIAQRAYGQESLGLDSIRVVRHKPGRRCLVAYKFHHRVTSAELTLLGKVHAKSRHEQSYRLQELFWNNGFDDQSNDGISVTRPIGIVPQWNMWLQEYVPGQHGWEALLGPNSKAAATRIADAARKLHQADILTERVHTVDDELQILEDRLRQTVRQIPRLKLRIEAVLDACQELASTIPSTRKTGIHRDFYPDQILVNNDRIYILDHDLYCIGHPSLDIGNFCAHLIEKGIRQNETTDKLMKSAHRMGEHFITLSGDVDRQAVDAYTTLSLARHIYLSTQFADRKSSTIAILEACEQRLATISVP